MSSCRCRRGCVSGCWSGRSCRGRGGGRRVSRRWRRRRCTSGCWSGRSCRGRGGGRRGRCARLESIALPASSRATRPVTEVLGKGGVVLLHSRRCAGVALTDLAVMHIKACLPFIQGQAEIGPLVGVVEINGAPFDVEDPVRRTAAHRDINAAGAARIPRAASPGGGVIISAQVVPVWEDGVVMSSPWQTDVIGVDIRSGELGIAVGRQTNTRETHVVEHEREGKRDSGYYVIPVIADVCRAQHATAACLIYNVLVPWRTSGRRGRRRIRDTRREGAVEDLHVGRRAAGLVAACQPDVVGAVGVGGEVAPRIDEGALR